MAKAKKELFNESEIEIASIAKALSHPARVKILNILNQRNVCITGEIVDLLPLAQATVSQHLKELKDVGLIKGEVEGLKMCYCINPIEMKKVKTAFLNLFSKINCC
jgi:DNA-binding transcriptional ArsR family regulator